MTDPSNMDFARGVSAALTAVSHLYTQVDRMNAALVAALRDEPDPFRFVGGTPLSSGRAGRLDRFVRGAYRLLLARGEDAAEDDDPGIEEDDDSGDADLAVASAARADRFTRPKGPAELESDGVYLAVNVVLHDPSLSELGPHVHWAVIGGFGVGPSGQPPSGGRLTLARYMVPRLLRAIDPSAPFDRARRIATMAKARGGGKRMGEGTVSFQYLAKPEMVPLEQLDGEEAVAKLMARIKQQFGRVVAGQDGK